MDGAEDGSLLSRALSGTVQVSDDALEFKLYPDPDWKAADEDEAAAASASAAADEAAVEEDAAGAKRRRLEALLELCAAFTQPLMAGYLWHHGAPWTLELAPDLSSLQGRLRFGDCVADEWFAAGLLYRLSERLPRCSLSLADSDGEFLLIEAAMHLPAWVSPSNSRHRVFVRGGALHLLPRALPPALPPAAQPPPAALAQMLRQPTLAGALALVRAPEGELPTAVAPAVNAAIAERLAEARRSARNENAHRCRGLLPPGVAHVLQREPSLVAAAVAAFCEREPKAAQRVCGAMRAFPPARPLSRTVRLTRCMHAQLAQQQQQFRPPRCFEPHLPRPVGAAALLGVKLACGFELLLHAHGAGRGAAAAAAAAAEPSDDAEATTAAAAARRVREILRLPADEARLRADSAAAEARVDDSDGWLSVDRDDLERMLAARYAPGGAAGGAQGGGADDEGGLEGMVDSGSDDSGSDDSGSDDSGGGGGGGGTGGGGGGGGGDEAHQLRRVADAVHAFVDAESGVAGVEGGAGAAAPRAAAAPAAPPVAAAAGAGTAAGQLAAIEFDADRFWALVQGTADCDIGSPSSDDEPGCGGAESSDDGGGFVPGRRGEAGASGQGVQRGGGGAEGGESEGAGEAAEGSAEPEAEPVVTAAATALRGEGHCVIDDDDASAGEGRGGSSSDSDDGSDFDSEADSDDGSDAGVRAMQEQLDEELRGSTVAQSFIRHTLAPVTAAGAAADGGVDEAGGGGSNEAGEELAPVDLDLNLVTHLLESFSSQQGLPGPASTLLHDMGVVLPAPEPAASGN